MLYTIFLNINNVEFLIIDIENSKATATNIFFSNISSSFCFLFWYNPANIIPIVGTTKVNHLLEIVKAKEIILTKEEWYSLYLASGHLLP